MVGLALVGAARTLAFGRFGYTRAPVVDGFRVDAGGFVALHPRAEQIRFRKPSELWRPFQTDAYRQTVGLAGGDGLPSKLRFDLAGLGFSLFCPQGLQLRIGTTQAPYLTWGEGSAGAGIPTPSVRWALLSFRDAQPPILFGFPTAPTDLQINGGPGDWRLEATNLNGWVRVLLPTGLEGVATNSAAALGRLSERIAPVVPFASALPPTLTDRVVEADPRSVTVRYRFSGPGARVPSGALLSELGGYRIGIRGAQSRLPFETGSGPIAVLQTEWLTIRFPIRRIPTGRVLFREASPLGEPPQGEGFADLARLAFGASFGQREPAWALAARARTDAFISAVPTVAEPWTKQRLPFDAAGSGLDRAAAFGLVDQAVKSALEPGSATNGLLDSVLQRMDADSWQLVAEDRDIARRAAAYAMVAAAYCPEPNRRMAGAMLESGLAAERGLAIWNRRRRQIPEPELVEALEAVRQVLTRAEPSGGTVAEIEASRALLSPYRVYGDLPSSIGGTPESPLLNLILAKEGEFRVGLAGPTDLRPQRPEGLDAFGVESSFGASFLAGRARAAGTIGVPIAAEPYPRWISFPPATETKRRSDLR